MVEYDYEKAISKEVKRLNDLYKNIPENKKKLVEGLIVQAARLRASCDALWLDIQKNGDTEMFQNGKDAEPFSKERPESKTFTARDKSYQAIIKMLDSYLPTESTGTSKLDRLLGDD